MVPHVHQSHVQNALKMNGVFVKIEVNEFLKLINENENLLIVHNETGIFTNQYLYLTAYKGFIFCCKSKDQLPLPEKNEKIYAQRVALPDM